MDIKIRVYHNPKYSGYYDENCYFMYFENGEMYLSTEDDLFRILQQPTIEITNDNIDSYSECRGFKKAVEFSSSNELIWYNDYDKDPKRAILKNKINNIKSYFLNNMGNALVKNSHIISICGILDRLEKCI